MFTTDFFQEDPRLAGQRRRLIDELKRKGISSVRVLEAVGKVPRQLFFPRDFEQYVYRDAAFPIGEGQTISQPYTVAFQTELLQIQPGDKVLEIGTGSGYQAAVLSAMGAQVFSVELVKSLLQEAGKVLKNIDSSIQLFHGDGTLGLQSAAPFDGILVTAGAPEVPQTYINQLKIGGRLVIPVGPDKNQQKMMRITKISDQQIKSEVLGDFKFVPLIGKNGWL
ncbi:MAG: protein-L-isoaspartate(D-aspartate) O-methyltransferase [Bacteroidia bacterium]|nr:protein-L-isoaspartate(D-aspartate) O-methyltransferase [Bacteroidia bacterium]